MKTTVEIPEDLVVAALQRSGDLDTAVVDALRLTTELENPEEMLER